MPGQSRTAIHIAILNELGEEEVFERIVAEDTIQDFLDNNHIGNEPGSSTKQGGIRAFYKWLHSEDGRWERYQALRKEMALASAERATQIALKTSPKSANADRLKHDALRARAEWLDRTTYGKSTQHQVAIGTPDQWLNALAQATNDNTLQTPAPHLAIGQTGRAVNGAEVQPDGEPEQPSGAGVQPSGELVLEPPPDSEEGAG